MDEFDLVLFPSTSWMNSEVVATPTQVANPGCVIPAPTTPCLTHACMGDARRSVPHRDIDHLRACQDGRDRIAFVAEERYVDRVDAVDDGLTRSERG